MLRSDDESVGLLSENWGWGWGLEQTRGESPRWDTRGGVLKAKGSDDGTPLPSPPSPLLPLSWLPPSPLPPPPLLPLPQCFERGPAPGLASSIPLQGLMAAPLTPAAATAAAVAAATASAAAASTSDTVVGAAQRGCGCGCGCGCCGCCDDVECWSDADDSEAPSCGEVQIAGCKLGWVLH